MWCGRNLCGGSINCHCLLLLRSLGALTPLPLVVPPLLAITFLLDFSLRWLLTLLVVVVIQFLGQSLGTIKRLRVCRYNIPWIGAVNPQINLSIFFPSEVIILGHRRDSSLNLDMYASILEF